MRNTAYKELRSKAHKLSLALLFQSEPQKQLLSTLFLLAIELDHSVATSEPMVGLIRLNWWQEQLEQPDATKVPLVMFLRQQMILGNLSASEIKTLIEHWVRAVQDGSEKSENWAELLGLMSLKAKLSEVIMAKDIGRAIAHSQTTSVRDKPIAIPSAAEIYRACGRGCEFLICLACIVSQTQKGTSHRYGILIFALLWQVVRRPESR